MNELGADLLKVATVMFQMIAKAGDAGIPSGHLYALLMAQGMSLATYEGILNVLKTQDLVKESDFLLTANLSEVK